VRENAMRIALSFMLGVFSGACIFWLAGQGVMKTTYSAKKSLEVRENAKRVTILPKGSVIYGLSGSFEPDIGWFGCVPVNFGTGFEAREILEPVRQVAIVDSRLFASEARIVK
jgi:predicted membrane protein